MQASNTQEVGRTRAANVQAILDTAFTYHPPKSEQLPKYEVLRARGKELAELIADLCPPSAEQTLAIRHIEQAVMYGNAAIARHT